MTPGYLSLRYASKTGESDNASAAILRVAVAGMPESETRDFILLPNDAPGAEYVFHVASTTNSSVVYRSPRVATCTTNPPSATVPDLLQLSTSEILAQVFEFTVGTAALVLPYIVIYVISGFHKGNSTVAEREWFMAWLCTGQFFGATVATIGRSNFSPLTPLNVLKAVIVLIPLVSAVGGFVQVIRMYLAFGSCSLSPS
ncbi:hypothetical protein GLOTRDRAFT_131617 [Gloeophyllum trabeum ATCC 11539]|uniref:Uncharacterized protein n=1 Tax=Gloeophyllum trabeum (strain ATCC 11539 / FP-39264 / Madison 617) TaxID=670483 RepID=S7Q089_GLOTA|nr:uncharacterized protein GLOTRDRAFT_131617 [Gloeophyllum trabeum ATCC 11539]EPQ53346.1 hypothetical protein GLOTRDRAFT_131617 [Gloeophyllum trabeum ATCC 11539]